MDVLNLTPYEIYFNMENDYMPRFLVLFVVTHTTNIG
jgi:hypothetical protein